MQFEIEFETRHLINMLEIARQEIAKPDEILGSIGESLYRANSKRHNAGKDPDGKEWKELSGVTLAKGDRKGGPLKRTGRMLASLNYAVTDDTLILGFDEPRVDGRLPGFHQRGHDKTDRHPGLPKRELLGFPQADRDLVEHVTVDHLTRILKRVR
jgi:phage virion morphogenesis protein